ncbi:MAG: hypothetical protein ABFC84_10860 [Veillonellales bacterium]
MKPLFKEKTGKFGSLISLIAIMAMLALFSIAIPEFLASTVGRIFAVVWALAAITVFIAHAKRVKKVRQRQYNIFHAEMLKKTVRTQKSVRTGRMLRG